MNKKGIAILGAIFLLIAGTLGFLVYSKYGAKKTSVDVPVTQAPPAEEGIPDPGSDNVIPALEGNPSAVVKLTDDQVISPVLFFDGSAVTYFNKEGQLFQANLDNTGSQLQLARKKILDIPQKSGIGKILWPARGDNFLAEFVALDGKKTWSFYNSKTGSYADLPTQVYSLDWLPSGDKIVYVWLDSSGKAYLNKANADTTGWQKISDLYQSDYVISVSPDGANLLFYRASNGNAANSIYLTTPDGKVWRTLVSSGYNFGSSWSPDGKKFLFNKKDSETQKYQLWLYNLMTDEARNINLSTTASKVAWSEDSQTFYAAVPTGGAADGDALTVDTFYKVDTSDFTSKQYQTGSVNVDGRDLFLSANGSKLFFKNAQDGGLYYLDTNQ